MNRPFRMSFHITLPIHLLGEVTARGDIREQHVAVPREQLFFEAVAFTRGARDMELVSGETIHNL
jgi:hypothetical protein